MPGRATSQRLSGGKYGGETRHDVDLSARAADAPKRPSSSSTTSSRMRWAAGRRPTTFSFDVERTIATRHSCSSGPSCLSSCGRVSRSWPAGTTSSRALLAGAHNFGQVPSEGLMGRRPRREPACLSAVAVGARGAEGDGGGAAHAWPLIVVMAGADVSDPYKD